MKEISTIGIDIAKSVFQVHSIDKAGEVVSRRQLKRRQVLPFFAGLKPCLVGSTSKAGNCYLRQLLVVGALAVIRCAKQLGYTRHPWLVKLMERRSVKIAAVALANNTTRWLVSPGP